ncbi:hypothetical protein [Nonomuraea sp. NPDC049309]|uniref:hypothetical protein n=1 Tax=Nonomuraea sp. NPDC049309 TaxID=3364350 RepID=UPI003712FA89
MFKRRFAVLGAAVALTVAGLTGSALAGTPSSPPEPAWDSTASAASGTGTLTCKTADGKVITLAKAKPAERGAGTEARPAQPADPPSAITQPRRAESVDPNGEPQVVSPSSGEGKAEAGEVKFRATRAAASGEPAGDAPVKVRVVTPSETQAEKVAETIEITCEGIAGAGLDD